MFQIFLSQFQRVLIVFNFTEIGG